MIFKFSDMLFLAEFTCRQVFCVEKENLLHYINWKLVVLIDVVMGEVYNIPHKKIDALR